MLNVQPLKRASNVALKTLPAVAWARRKPRATWLNVRHMRALSLFAALVAALGSGQALSQSPTPEEVMASVKGKGAKTTVNEIWSSQARANQVLAGVRSAKPQWLAVAKSLSLGADAGASEELNDAISVALLKAPYQLLPWLKETWWKGGQTACLFGYDSELPGGVKNYVAKLSRALRKQAPNNLESLRQECLHGLEQTREDLKAAPK